MLAFTKSSILAALLYYVKALCMMASQLEILSKSQLHLHAVVHFKGLVKHSIVITIC